MRISTFGIKTFLFVALAAIVWVAAIWYGFFKQESHALPLPTSAWKTVFEDDFNGTSLNTAKWTTCYDWYNATYNGCTNEGNYESEWYMDSQVSVQDGYVKLSAIKQPVVGWYQTYERTYQYRSGMITTGRAPGETNVKWGSTYGYYEARMKVSGGTAVWPAFWLLPTDKSWPPEIDVMELLGQLPNEILLTYHWPGEQGPAKDEGKYVNGDFTTDWHTYAVNWQADQIDWYVDGVLRKTAKGPHVPDKEMMVLFNLAIGGNLPGQPDDTTPDTSEVLVDYIRIKQPAAKQ